MSSLKTLVRDEMMYDRELDPWGDVKNALYDLLGAMQLTKHAHLIPADWQYRPGESIRRGESSTPMMEIVRQEILSGRVSEEDMSLWLRVLYKYEGLCYQMGRNY